MTLPHTLDGNWICIMWAMDSKLGIDLTKRCDTFYRPKWARSGCFGNELNRTWTTAAATYSECISLKYIHKITTSNNDDDDDDDGNKVYSFPNNYQRLDVQSKWPNKSEHFRCKWKIPWQLIFVEWLRVQPDYCSSFEPSLAYIVRLESRQQHK